MMWSTSTTAMASWLTNIRISGSIANRKEERKVAKKIERVTCEDFDEQYVQVALRIFGTTTSFENLRDKVLPESKLLEEHKKHCPRCRRVARSLGFLVSAALENAERQNLVDEYLFGRTARFLGVRRSEISKMLRELRTRKRQ